MPGCVGLPFFPFFSLWWFHTHCWRIWSDVHYLVRYLAWPATYIMQFLRVTQLSACLEAPRWWTNDDWYVSEALKNYVFILHIYLYVPPAWVVANDDILGACHCAYLWCHFFTYMKLLLFAILFPFSYCGGFSPSIENLGLSNQRRHVSK
jgi:hypothetical protein